MKNSIDRNNEKMKLLILKNMRLNILKKNLLQCKANLKKIKLSDLALQCKD